MNAKLTRTLAVGSYGKDVDGVKRAVYRGLDRETGGYRLKAHASKTAAVRRTYGAFFRKDVLRLETLMQKTPGNGKVEPAMWDAMVKRRYPDALAEDLVQQYADNHKPAPPPPVYVEPTQGFDSLRKDLWEAFTLGRNRGLADLGTYNPNSRLPSGRPSDHAVFPAAAFDLGFSPATGYGNAKARAFFHDMCGRPEVEYVICGTRIWSVDRGLHTYSGGGHENHVHVSGHR